MNFRVEAQLAEAIGELNCYYTALVNGRYVDKRETDLLLTHFVKSGGAVDFAFRYSQAMGPENRWFCSEFYGREISHPEILWDYYRQHSTPRPGSN